MTPVKSQTKHTQPDFRLWAKGRLLESGMSVTELAKRLKQSRVNVSTAINHPTLRHDLKERIEAILAKEEAAS